MDLERLNQHQFERFRDFIYQESGIWVSEKKVALLSNRIRSRLKAGEFENFDLYYRHLTSKAGRAELEGFLDAITTNETFFFRTEKHFDWLSTQFLTEMNTLHRDGGHPRSLRIWSAGCAGGAEPYSIAICLLENRHLLADWSLEILGTDISEEALRGARAGVFKPRETEAVSKTQQRRFFQKKPGDDGLEVGPAVKELVQFKRHNLMQPLPEPAFDCIFIRNVLIYFDGESKRVVVDNLINALAVGGFMVVGPSEGIYDMLEPLKKLSPFLYRKVDSVEPSTRTGSKKDMRR